MIAPPIVDRPKGWDLVPTNGALLKRIGTGASWVYWVAGLSLVNNLLLYLRVPLQFPFAIGFTDLVYGVGLGMAQRWGRVFLGVSGFLDLCILGVVAGLGFLASRRKKWAVVGALVILSLDTLLLLVIVYLGAYPVLVDVGFHGIALYFLWIGLKSLGIYEQREREGLT